MFFLSGILWIFCVFVLFHSLIYIFISSCYFRFSFCQFWCCIRLVCGLVQVPVVPVFMGHLELMLTAPHGYQPDSFPQIHVTRSDKIRVNPYEKYQTYLVFFTAAKYIIFCAISIKYCLKSRACHVYYEGADGSRIWRRVCLVACSNNVLPYLF